MQKATVDRGRVHRRAASTRETTSTGIEDNTAADEGGGIKAGRRRHELGLPIRQVTHRACRDEEV